MAQQADLFETIKDHNQDFDFYPTTDEIILSIRNHMRSVGIYSFTSYSILDIGAGDGKTLNKITDNSGEENTRKGEVSKYSIEKSDILRAAQTPDIFSLGTDFYQQCLFNMKFDIVYNNPPFNELSPFVLHLLNTVTANHVYLTLPLKWRKCKKIAAVMESKGIKPEVILETTFLFADRKANVNVEVLYIKRLGMIRNGLTDTFADWFKNEFNFEVIKPERGLNLQERLAKSDKSGSSALCVKKDPVNQLVDFFNTDQMDLFEQYKSLSSISGSLLGELGVNADDITKSFAVKYKELKASYWRQVVDCSETLTKQMTQDTKKSIIDVIIGNTDMDFTTSNVRSVILWAIKSFNSNSSDQLEAVFKQFVQQTNVSSYKSNHKLFKENKWRYGDIPSGLEKYHLETKVILDCHWLYQAITYDGLKDGVIKCFDDILAIAITLGFDTFNTVRTAERNWEYGKRQTYYYVCTESNKELVLFEAKIFKKGTFHINFNSEFMQAFNIAFGRINGWINSPQEASSEMDIDENVAIKYFNTSIQLKHTPSSLLTLPNAA